MTLTQKEKPYRWLIALIAAFGLSTGFGVTACSDAGGEASETAEAEAEDESESDEETLPTPVEIAVSRTGDIYNAYSGTATLEAFEEATVVAKVDGEIATIVAEEGDVVKAGDVLARLDGDRLRLRLEEARANLAKAEREYNRNVDLHEKGLVASGAFEAIKYDMDALRAGFNIARLEYNYATIKAPISGVISERMVKTGNTISANTPVFHIVNLQPLVAYLHAPEREFGRLAAGQPVYVSVDALEGSQFQGKVSRISPLVNAESGTFKVTVEMSPADLALKPGMFARISIVHDTRPNAILVPSEALVETEVGTSLFVVEDGKAVRREVELGYTWQNEIQILSGVETDESVVVIGHSALKPDAAVEVINPPDGTAQEKTDTTETGA